MNFIEKVWYRVLFKINILRNPIKYLKRYFKYRDTLFLVYSAGKTGSSTVYYTLMKEFPLNQVLHVHLLSDNWINKILPERNEGKKCRNQDLAHKVYKALERKKNIKVITLIRDPFSRGLSAYFHNPDLRQKAVFKDNEIIRNEILNYASDISLQWFETDFNNFFNYDIFQHSFDKETGVKKISLDNKFDILLLKTNNLSKNGKDEISNLLQTSIDTLFSVNNREKGAIGKIYKSVKDNYFEEETIFNSKINSKFVNHFFTKNEIQSFKSKYLENNK